MIQRLALIGAAAILAAVCAVIFAAEYRVFRFTTLSTGGQVQALGAGELPPAQSGWSQLRLNNYCLEVLSGDRVRLMARAQREQALASCAELATQGLARNPASAESLAIRAMAAHGSGAAQAEVLADLARSNAAGPYLAWLADRRLSFVMSQDPDPIWAPVVQAEARSLAKAPSGLARLAQAYVTRTDLRDPILTQLETEPAALQQQFLKITRQLTRARAEQTGGTQP